MVTDGGQGAGPVPVGTVDVRYRLLHTGKSLGHHRDEGILSPMGSKPTSAEGMQS
jgi:hypothetical protein